MVARPAGAIFIWATKKVYNYYKSSDLRDSTGLALDYESSAPYYSLHAGLGYMWHINPQASLDIYSKYFWTHQEGDSLNASTGERLRFKSVDSQRVRTGLRFAYTINQYIDPYIGAGWEYEFSGKALATSNGLTIDAPQLKGGSGIGELGLVIKPTQTMPISFDMGVQGYTGKRQGVTGSLQFKVEF